MHILTRVISQLNEIAALPGVNICLWGDSTSRATYEYFTRPHPRYKIIQNKRWGVGLLKLPDSFDLYLKGKEKEYLRRKRNHALKSGYTFASFAGVDHIDEILAINASMPVRQGKTMHGDYLDPIKVRAFAQNTGSLYGVFDREGVLKGYAFTPVIGEVFVFSRLLGHEDDLEAGVMYLLVSQVINEMVARKNQAGYPIWAMYDTFFGASAGLRYFKEKLGFTPHKVRWKWATPRSFPVVQEKNYLYETTYKPMDRISTLRRKFPFARMIRRALKITPMQRVLRKLEARGVSTSELEALDIFGGTGAMHTVDYASRVASLEVWELDPACEAALRRNLPQAEIKITDSFQELKQTPKKYSLIVADNPMGVFGPNDEYCEHFDLFPDILRVASDSSLLILVAIPKIDAAALRRYPYLLSSRHRQRRMDFYKTAQPDDIPFDTMIAVYKDLLSTNGFELEWYFFERRTFIYSLVLKIRKT